MISDKTIERLILYRRILLSVSRSGATTVYSHDLAKMAGSSPAQVRRDFMAIGYFGSPVYGYNIEELLGSISDFIDSPQTENVIVVGMGNLGRSIVDYIRDRRPKITIDTAFDIDPNKVDRVIHGCRCYHLDRLETVISEKGVRIAILTVPAEQAPRVVDRLIEAGIRGILNYAPVKLQVPPGIYVLDRDMIMAVEKIAYYVRKA